MVSVEPSSRARGTRKISPRAMISVPASRAYTTPVAAILEALSVCCRPSSMEMKLPLPWPKKKPVAWKIAIREKATPTAPVALLEWSCPTKKVSTML